jgi:hypothetical protein
MEPSMRESTVTISRCKAVAAHGRRCMQTPYMTSPFCWHHTARADREELRREALRGDEHSKVLAERILGTDLTPAQIERIEKALEAEAA